MINVYTRDMQVAIVLAKHLHFGKAAKELGLSTSSISRTITRLEEASNVKLFDRTNRTVGLTDDGDRMMRNYQLLIDLLSGKELSIYEGYVDAKMQLKEAKIKLAKIKAVIGNDNQEAV